MVLDFHTLTILQILNFSPLSLFFSINSSPPFTILALFLAPYHLMAPWLSLKGNMKTIRASSGMPPMVLRTMASETLTVAFVYSFTSTRAAVKHVKNTVSLTKMSSQSSVFDQYARHHTLASQHNPATMIANHDKALKVPVLLGVALKLLLQVLRATVLLEIGLIHKCIISTVKGLRVSSTKPKSAGGRFIVGGWDSGGGGSSTNPKSAGAGGRGGSSRPKEIAKHSGLSYVVSPVELSNK